MAQTIYVSQADVVAKLGEVKACRLFRDDGKTPTAPVSPNPETRLNPLFDLLMPGVCSQVDGYLRRRYTLPLATVPDELKQMVMDLAVYETAKRRDAVSEGIAKVHDDVLKWLKDCSNGSVDLGIEPEPVANTTRGPEYSTETRRMTRDNLKTIL
jgi:phage gp36-like protein